MGWPKGKPRKSVDSPTETIETTNGKSLTYCRLSDIISTPPPPTDERRTNGSTDEESPAGVQSLPSFDSVSVGSGAAGVGDPRGCDRENNYIPPISTAKYKKLSEYRMPTENACACWHCRTFTSRVKATLGDILREEV